MHLVRFAGALALSVALIPGAGAQGLVVPATEKKIDALIAQMTLEEKVGQLNQYCERLRRDRPTAERAGRRRRCTTRSARGWWARC